MHCSMINTLKKNSRLVKKDCLRSLAVCILWRAANYYSISFTLVVQVYGNVTFYNQVFVLLFFLVLL